MTHRLVLIDILCATNRYKLMRFRASVNVNPVHSFIKPNLNTPWQLTEKPTLEKKEEGHNIVMVIEKVLWNVITL